MKIKQHALMACAVIIIGIIGILFVTKSDAFEGPYVGGSFGGILSPVNHIGDKITDVIITTGGGTSFKDQWQTARKPSLNLTVNAGYGVLFDKHYCGLEAGVNKSRYRVSIKKSRQDCGLNTHDELNLNLRDVDFSLDYKHGFVLSEKTMVYGKAGIVRTRARMNLISNATVKFADISFNHADFIKHEKTIHPMRIGFGVEHKIFDNVSMTLDYTYSRKIGSFKVKGNTKSNTPAATLVAHHNHKMTIQSTSIMLGLKTYL